jgi:hypothetical protein
MATGTVTAPEPKVDTKTETTETCTAEPVTLTQRIKRLLCEVFEGHEHNDYIDRARGM